MIRYQSMILCQFLTTHLSDKVPLYRNRGVRWYVYVSQSKIHILQKVGSESMKPRTHISDIDSWGKLGTFEVVMEVYQLTLLGVSTNPPNRVS